VTPTDAPIPILEQDLQPVYKETVAQAYMDVEINFSLLTDASLDSSNPHIHRIFINPRFNNYEGENSKDALAHFAALTFYKLWHSRQDTNQPVSDAEFKSYLELWSQAQKSNDLADWEKVQINGIWANDLNDGNGYKQQEYTIWPMYTGDPSQVPQGVRAIAEFGISFVRAVQMENVTMVGDGNFGVGFNLYDNILYVYIDFGGHGQDEGGWGATYAIAYVANWLIKNRGGSSFYGPLADRELYKLVNRHSNIGDCCYRAALKIDPPTKSENTYNP
jgi:hypothetical protein